VLYGGCLSLLVASLGTPYAAQTEGKLLFLEDLGEKPYQIDRMLRQLRLAGKLDGVTGIIFGEMLECASPSASPHLTEKVIEAVLDWFPGPIAYGLRSGHVSRSNVTLPFGVEAELIVHAEKVQERDTNSAELHISSRATRLTTP
jgi:muramoyltetrapeptide carboxypeptidase